MAAAMVLGAVLVATGVFPSASGSVSAQEKISAVPAASADAAALPVSVAPVTLREISRTVDAVGTFTGFEEVTVTAEVPGRVIKVHHDVADVVKPGDALVDIDPTDYQLAVNEAGKAFLADLTRLGLADYAERLGEEIPQSVIDRAIREHPMIQRVIQEEENARRKYERAQQLSKDNAVSREDLEQFQTNYEVARNNRIQAFLDAQSIVASMRLRAAVLATAMEKLRKTHVVVPPSALAEAVLGKGQEEYVVAKRRVSEGEMVKDSPNAGMAVFDLVIMRVLKLYGHVPERYSGQVCEGQPVEVRVDAYPDKVYPGTVLRVSPTVDPVSRTFEVEVKVPNPTRPSAPGCLYRPAWELQPGGFARLFILTTIDKEAITVPPEAVVTFAGSIKVFVVRDGKAHAIPVSPGITGPGWEEVIPTGREKLLPTDQVITSEPQQLADGMPVRIRSAEAP